MAQHPEVMGASQRVRLDGVGTWTSMAISPVVLTGNHLVKVWLSMWVVISYQSDDETILTSALISGRSFPGPDINSTGREIPEVAIPRREFAVER